MPKTIKRTNLPDLTAHLTLELLAEAVRARRTQENLRLEDAAMLFGIAKETLSRIEKGKPGVRFETILKVCNMLGIKLTLKVSGTQDE